MKALIEKLEFTYNAFIQAYDELSKALLSRVHNVKPGSTPVWLIANSAAQCVRIVETANQWDGEVADRYIGIKVEPDGKITAIRANTGKGGQSYVNGLFEFNGTESYDELEENGLLSYQDLLTIPMNYIIQLLHHILIEQ